MPFRAMRNGFRAFRPYFVGVLAPSYPERAFSQQIPNRFSGCTAKQFSSWLCMTKKFFEVKRGNVVVKVYERNRTKAGRSYPEFIVDDRSSGGRKFWTRSTLADAKVKAAEVADAIQKGNVPGQPMGVGPSAGVKEGVRDTGTHRNGYSSSLPDHGPGSAHSRQP